MVTTTDAGGNITRHGYDKGGMLSAVYLTPDGGSEKAYVQDIHYDAKGQREAIWYGNGTKTRYTYDPLTYRLRRLLTINLNTSPHTILQDLNYTYDPVGNITRIKDKALNTVFYNNSIIKPELDYTYDALYRLVKASGREMINDGGFSNDKGENDVAMMMSATPQWDGSALQHYTQYYTYDNTGNITQLQHSTGKGSYTRNFSFGNGNNRLQDTDIDSIVFYYGNYDNRGNMTGMPHLKDMYWDFSNQLCTVNMDGIMYSYYQYSGGQRVRKYTNKGYGNIKEERIYLGSFEIYRKYDGAGTLTLERTTVHIADDSGRIAMLETRTQGYDDSPQVLERYIYSNHLGSSSLELDENAAIISYEEYHPYGTTAYQAMNSDINAVAKRYRYTGKERDEETGLYYHGARYYAPWLCRWTAVDPKESERSGKSPYDYCSNNPINRHDPDGMKDEKKDGGWYTDAKGKAHFVNGIHTPEEFKKLGLKGKFFGVIQGEYNADGSHTQPHYKTFGGGHANNHQNHNTSTAQHKTVAPAKPVTAKAPAPHTAIKTAPPAPTPTAMQQFGAGFKEGATENLQSLKDAVTTPQGIATIAAGAAAVYLIPGLGQLALGLTLGVMAYQAITAAKNLHDGNYHEAGKGTGSLTVDATVMLATVGIGKLKAGGTSTEGGSNLWKVGRYNEIKGTEVGLDAHHVGQKALMAKLVPGYNLKTAPAILVPLEGHTTKGVNGIVSRNTNGIINVKTIISKRYL